MKKVTKTAAVLVLAAMLALLPNANAFTAKAAEPVSYAVKFIPDKGEWRMQANTNLFEDDKESREIYYLRQDIQEGDIVVVYNDTDTSVILDLGNTHLSNLTLVQNTQSCVIKSGGATECYVLGGSISSIGGDMTNAYVYGTTICTFVGNVGTLTMYSDGDQLTSSVSIGGTTEHLYARPGDLTLPYSFYDLYRFSAGTLYVKEGILQTASWAYLTAEQYAAQTAEPQDSNSTQTVAPQDNNSTQPPAATPKASDGYDEVPKTGQNSLYVWFLCAAVLFFAGSCILRRAGR